MKCAKMQGIEAVNLLWKAAANELERAQIFLLAQFPEMLI